MATQTDHMKLTKPALNESADITVINTNMDTIDQVTSKILPVITGSLNNSGYPIASGEYFEADGNMYKATQAIPTGQAWSSSATQLSSNGIINALNGDIGTLNGNLQNKFHTKSYTFSNLSFEAGELATRGLQVSQDISSDISSYGTPVSALITHIDDSGKCNFQSFIFNSMLYVNGYRASVNSMGSNKVIVLILFVKS